MMRIVHQFVLLVKYLIVAIVGLVTGAIFGYVLAIPFQLLDNETEYAFLEVMFAMIGMAVFIRYFGLRYDDSIWDNSFGCSIGCSQFLMGFLCPFVCMFLLFEVKVRVEFNILFTIFSLFLGVGLGTVVHKLAIRDRNSS